MYVFSNTTENILLYKYRVLLVWWWTYEETIWINKRFLFLSWPFVFLFSSIHPRPSNLWFVSSLPSHGMVASKNESYLTLIQKVQLKASCNNANYLLSAV
jgi:hypothetical protein